VEQNSNHISFSSFRLCITDLFVALVDGRSSLYRRKGHDKMLLGQEAAVDEYEAMVE
jgi:hypothetical protein